MSGWETSGQWTPPGPPFRPECRGTHRSIQALEKDTRNWITAWNTNPKPFLWTKTADEILDNLATYCQRISDSGH